MAYVLFLSCQDAGRSQMARALLARAAEGRHEAESAGSRPATRIGKETREAMAELGVDLTGRRPQGVTRTTLSNADLVVTMGCGQECPEVPGPRYLHWEVTDPAGLPLELLRYEVSRQLKLSPKRVMRPTPQGATVPDAWGTLAIPGDG